MSTLRKSKLLKKSPNALRKLCKLRNLNSDGTKDELINRLRGPCEIEKSHKIIANKTNTIYPKSNRQMTPTKKTHASTSVKPPKTSNIKNEYSLFKNISECKQSNVFKCKSLQRIKILLKNPTLGFYIPPNIQSTEYTDIKLLDDFCHIKYHHKINKNTDAFQQIQTDLIKLCPMLYYYFNHQPDISKSDNTMFNHLISKIWEYFTDQPQNTFPKFNKKRHKEAVIVHGFIRRNTTTYFANILQECVMMYYKFLPPSVPTTDETSLFWQNVYLCQIKSDFNDKSTDMIELRQQKEAMFQWIDNIYEKWRDNGNKLLSTETFYPRILSTIASNIFRTSPVTGSSIAYEEADWNSLKLVYDLLWRVINSVQFDSTFMVNTWKNSNFLPNLVELFSSKEHRERQYLMLLLHKIYGRSCPLRPYITHIIFEYLYRRIYNCEFEHNLGIEQLLQIICAIIPGLTVPIKTSWKHFLENILIPLHKCSELQDFWEHLTQCLVNYAAKDSDGAVALLVGLLKLWPTEENDPIREMIFIMEIVNVMRILINHHIDGNNDEICFNKHKKILIRFWNKLTDCMLSTDESVAERAIQAFNEPVMQRLVELDTKTFLPKLVQVFYKNKNNQNRTLKELSIATWRNYQSIRGVDVY